MHLHGYQILSCLKKILANDRSIEQLINTKQTIQQFNVVVEIANYSKRIAKYKTKIRRNKKIILCLSNKDWIVFCMCICCCIFIIHFIIYFVYSSRLLGMSAVYVHIILTKSIFFFFVNRVIKIIFKNNKYFESGDDDDGICVSMYSHGREKCNKKYSLL